ncbi:hypothetical protein CTEN210_02290 [Chaetoceros tenuissimus]|uniref:Uncharacterized protein n=1 Tax=Chaetoceros tenuissimus TaxID=426638 RepID=A0AAD3CJ59_9STRA|nr:hypothetical protein CTEN210_02290 [Chaetoceros tenuissimus]
MRDSRKSVKVTLCSTIVGIIVIVHLIMSSSPQIITTFVKDLGPYDIDYSLNTTLCTGKCEGDCKTFVTPVMKCYNGISMFGESEENPFGAQDILDKIIRGQWSGVAIAIERRFYDSVDGTCSKEKSDQFDSIPLDLCVGPFGEPHPWGTLHLIKHSFRSYWENIFYHAFDK